MYIVHFSQDEALKNARALASYGVSDKAQREEIKQAMKGTKLHDPLRQDPAAAARCRRGRAPCGHAAALPPARGDASPNRACCPVICGTDTLGVGINVPIHTVVLTAAHQVRRPPSMRRLRCPRVPPDRGPRGTGRLRHRGHGGRRWPPSTRSRTHKAMLKAGDDPKKQRQREEEAAARGLRQLEQADLRAPHREAAGEADAPHAHHPFHGAVRGVARRRCLRPTCIRSSLTRPRPPRRRSS